MSGGSAVKSSKKVHLSILISNPEPSDDESISCAERFMSKDWTPDKAFSTHIERLSMVKIAKAGFSIGAMLAGGCLRDFFIGRASAKDYDLFACGTPEDISPLPEDDFGYGKLLPTDAIKNMRSEVKGLYKYHEASIDIICVDRIDIREIVQTFDCSICQIWVECEDGEPIVYCTREFLEYIKNKIWYRYTNIEACNNHMERIIKKFGSGFKLKNKCEFEAVRIGPLQTTIDRDFLNK